MHTFTEFAELAKMMLGITFNSGMNKAIFYYTLATNKLTVVRCGDSTDNELVLNHSSTELVSDLSGAISTVAGNESFLDCRVYASDSLIRIYLH